jgi:hypothetical protein
VLQNNEEETEAARPPWLGRQQQIDQTFKSERATKRRRSRLSVNALLTRRGPWEDRWALFEGQGRWRERERESPEWTQRSDGRTDDPRRDEAREKELKERLKNEAELRKLNQDSEKQVENLNTRIHRMLERQLAQPIGERRRRRAVKSLLPLLWLPSPPKQRVLCQHWRTNKKRRGHHQHWENTKTFNQSWAKSHTLLSAPLLSSEGDSRQMAKSLLKRLTVATNQLWSEGSWGSRGWIRSGGRERGGRVRDWCTVERVDRIN